MARELNLDMSPERINAARRLFPHGYFIIQQNKDKHYIVAGFLMESDATTSTKAMQRDAPDTVYFTIATHELDRM